MNKRTRNALLLAGMQIAFGLVAVAGKARGYWDGDMAARISMTGIGLMLLFTANFMSKTVARSARVIANQRLLGWSMMLGALVWTGSWLFASIPIAAFIAMAGVALGTFAPILYCRIRKRWENEEGLV